MLKPAEDSPPATAAASDMPFRTDCASSGYEISRFNACTWQTRREDVMVCLGAKCKYELCGFAEEEMPPLGSECPWERWYGRKLLRQFDQMFPRDGLGQHLDDLPARRKEWALSHLLANRASIRASLTLQRCFDAITNRGSMPYDRKPFEEWAVAERYRTAAYNRINALWDQLPAIQEKAQLDRMRCLMIFHGYWKPHDGQPKPKLEDVPGWIRDQVEKRQSGG